jgi:hypothetical protein
MNEVIKKTGNYWGNILSILIKKPNGWKSQKEFESLYITKEEFLERAAISEVEPAVKVSRRDAAKMLKKLSNYE